MGLIKSDIAPTSLTPFSMKDVEMQARALLLGARRTAEKLLVEAQQAGEQLREQAQTEGFESGKRDGLRAGHEEGLAAGRAQALSDHSDAFAASVSALSQAMADIEKSRRAMEAEALSDVVRLSVAIAQRITKRQAVLDPQVMVENLREAMRLVVHASDVRIVIHPDQRATLDAALPELQLEFPQLHHVKIIDDSALTPGGCRVMTAGGEINADLNTQLDRVIADLLPADNSTSSSNADAHTPSSGTPGEGRGGGL